MSVVLKLRNHVLCRVALTVCQVLMPNASYAQFDFIFTRISGVDLITFILQIKTLEAYRFSVIVPRTHRPLSGRACLQAHITLTQKECTAASHKFHQDEFKCPAFPSQISTLATDTQKVAPARGTLRYFYSYFKSNSHVIIMGM